MVEIRHIASELTKDSTKKNFENINYSLRTIAKDIKDINKISDRLQSISNDDSLFNPVLVSKPSIQYVSTSPVTINNWLFGTIVSSPLSEYLYEPSAGSGILVAKKKCTILSTLSLDMYSTLEGTIEVLVASSSPQRAVVASTAKTSASTDSVATLEITSTIKLDVGSSLFYTAKRIYGTDITLSQENISTWELMRVK